MPRPLLVALCLAGAVSLAAAQEKKPAKPAGIRIGQFTFKSDGGKASIDFKNPKRQVWDVRGPAITLRSEGLDLDARHIHAAVEGKVVRDGFADGAVKLVMRSPGLTDTLYCEKAVLKLDANGKTGRIDLTGGVRWVHTGPEVEGPAEFKGSKGTITRGGVDEGPVIELDDMEIVATPREPAPKPKGKS